MWSYTVNQLWYELDYCIKKSFFCSNKPNPVPYSDPGKCKKTQQNKIKKKCLHETTHILLMALLLWPMDFKVTFKNITKFFLAVDTRKAFGSNHPTFIRKALLQVFTGKRKTDFPSPCLPPPPPSPPPPLSPPPSERLFPRFTISTEELCGRALNVLNFFPMTQRNIHSHVFSKKFPKSMLFPAFKSCRSLQTWFSFIGNFLTAQSLFLSNFPILITLHNSSISSYLSVTLSSVCCAAKRTI